MSNDDLIKQLQKINIVRRLQEGTDYLRDVHNVPYGYFEESGDEITIHDLSGMPWGTYSKSENVTRTMTGVFVGDGNSLVRLLPTK